MSFDTQTRNRLSSFVGKCRTLLCGDFKSPGGEMARQLAHYGIQDTGKFFEVDSLTHLDEPGRETARTLRSILAHKQASAPAAKVWKKFDAAVYDLIQEQGFTVLNRLCALRMAEERKILQFPCISKGLQSDGFELYEYHTGKANAAISKEDRFQHFVFSLFDELSLDLGSLFDRFSPQGLLFPAPQALGELLDLINDPALAPLWAEDETIGWIYQYWNSKEERKAMRDASAAPRNSRELAVRNQFFTPRYVVQFLTDNTLGRIWYEMCQGRTALKDECRYLVRRPNEIFLAQGESAPEVPSDQLAVISEEGMSQEELLKQPVYIPFRPLKDPREIRLLDPACGSMHFGLYAFDLFEKIYSEFWDRTIAEGGAASSTDPSSEASAKGDHRSLITDHSLQPLPELYASKEAYMLEVPKMIIEHNIHGIDIDPRAAQIAGLALWLRAQRSWQNAGLLATQRPKVERSNIVCAEPMPGDKEQLREFTAQLHPAIALMVAAIFDKMQLAGEAGSLLKIEEEITTLVDNAKAAWKQIGKHEGEMFSTAELVNADRRTGTQTQLDIGSWNLETLSAISDSDFFEQAEHTIYQALARYAESATQGSYKRKLFAHDAAQGFAFIDICRKRYDATVMNPPFGEAASSTGKYLGANYKRGKNDLYCAFVMRGAKALASAGLLGAITNRTGFFIKTLSGWRKEVFLEDHDLALFADLGDGVLDTALVETAAYIVSRSKSIQPAIFLRVVEAEVDAKNSALLSKIQGKDQAGIYISATEEFNLIPQAPFAYWVDRHAINLFSKSLTLSSLKIPCKQGVITADDFRFLRLRWEAPSGIGQFSFDSSDQTWAPLAKGGEFRQFVGSFDVLVLADNEFQEIIISANKKYPYLNGGAQNMLHLDPKLFLNGGCFYTRRTSKDFSVRALPLGCVYSDKGPGITFSESQIQDIGEWPLMGILNSDAFRALLALGLGAVGAAARSYETGLVEAVPLPNLGDRSRSMISSLSSKCYEGLVKPEMVSEESIYFLTLINSRRLKTTTINELASLASDDATGLLAETTEALRDLNELVWEAYGLDQDSRSMLCISIGSEVNEDGDDLESDADDPIEIPALDERTIATRIFSYSIGTAFGRWDIRYATGEREAPELPDPFDPLPVCPPGMLQNESGLPLSIAELTELNAEGSYPLRVSIDGILVDDAGHVSEDIVARVREALAVIWGERSGAIEQEACDILKVKELRDYFSEGKSGGRFFKDHLKRYSKSRRKAPIYWPISTESGGYTLWFYYHRLTEDSLYTAVTRFIVPRQEEAAATFARLGAKQDRSKAEDKELESAQTLVAELATLKDSLLEIAKFWKPNLNDGVQITAAPLWKHFRLGAWQKVLKDTWSELQKGEYDWAHLAHSIWPERVIPKCITDRSLAIAHGHEEALWEEVENDKGKLVWQPKKDAEEIAKELIKQYGK